MPLYFISQLNNSVQIMKSKLIPVLFKKVLYILFMCANNIIKNLNITIICKY